MNCSYLLKEKLTNAFRFSNRNCKFECVTNFKWNFLGKRWKFTLLYFISQKVNISFKVETTKFPEVSWYLVSTKKNSKGWVMKLNTSVQRPVVYCKLQKSICGNIRSNIYVFIFFIVCFQLFSTFHLSLRKSAFQTKENVIFNGKSDIIRDKKHSTFEIINIVVYVVLQNRQHQLWMFFFYLENKNN